MKGILITGVNGFVGKELFKYFLKRNFEVYGIYRTGTPINKNCFQVDLTDGKETSGLFKEKLKGKVDVIIHTASRIAKTDNLDDLTLIRDNSEMAKNLAMLSKDNSIKRIINFSSSSVYPNLNGEFNEGSLVDPSVNSDGIYGLSKLNSEMIFDYFTRSASVLLTHLRIGMIYGEGMDETRLMPMFKKELKESNTITVYGNGERFINQINVAKLCEYIVLFVQKSFSGIYNVGDEYISTKELAQQIINKEGNAQSKIILVEKGRRNTFKLNIEKLKNILN